ncbi:MAG: pseudouridine synthase [Terracidiphilus sp.]
MATKKAAKSAKTGEPKTKPIKQKAKVAPRKAKATPEAEIPEATQAGGIGDPVFGSADDTVSVTIGDPIGDTSDGEARTLLADEPAPEVAAEESFAEKAGTGEASEEEEGEEEFTSAERPPAKLERLQKILSQAGVASRRKAEEMIEQGRVQVNGAVVTALGTKADANRDHIRVDGKLLHGAERLRYFVLNKPKGFVTTVKDPEGRPTVMQFFDKMRERLYPVGRLDYMSEGLLLVTNDGDLANKLTKAGSGVEKVYLVKVAGQPTESELELLRGGVNIERGKPGSPQVRTSPARIRQVRQGDNPWYEVVLIEGRNRELRKMFVAVGHFVEKIRRVGYGPLVLDQEPGNMRELEAEELAALRLAAEGKLRTPKAKEVRRRNLADAQLPTVKPKPSRPNPGKPFAARPPFEAQKSFAARKPSEPGEIETRPETGERSSGFKPRRDFGAEKTFRPARPAGGGFRPAEGRGGAERGKFGAKKFDSVGSGAVRPAWKKDDRAPRPQARFGPGATGERRPPAGKPFGDRPAGRVYGAQPAVPAAGRGFGSKPAGRPFAGKPFEGKSGAGRPPFGKPAWAKTGGSDRGPSNRPPFKKPSSPRRDAPAQTDDFAPIKPGGLRIDPVGPDRYEARGPKTFSKPPVQSGVGRPSFDRSGTGKSSFGKPGFENPRSGGARFERPRTAETRFEKPRFEKSRFDRAGSGRSDGPGRGGLGSGSGRPPRSESGLARPFTTSSGKPRAGGARPASKPFKPGGSAKPRPGGFSKSGPKGAGFKGKPGGAKRSGSRPGNKRRG